MAIAGGLDRVVIIASSAWNVGVSLPRVSNIQYAVLNQIPFRFDTHDPGEELGP